MLSLLGMATWAFSTGLAGDLIFDDYPNFLPWQQIGDINTWERVLQFTLSGNGFPGRPLSLASFLIDDQSWIPDVQSLKRTNLAIHLVNSCLVLWLCLKLLSCLLPDASDKKRLLLAFFASSIWTLHPLQVSNVSYIIQRMNLLSSMFELIGLLIFFRGRELLNEAPLKAVIYCSIGIGGLMPVAILAKENGLLLCAFALLLDRYCFQHPGPMFFRIWKGFFLWLPLAAFLAYCLNEYDFFTQKLAIRNFTSWERLLTQGPILQDYLSKLLLPRLSGSTLYYENFPVSRSLLSPPATLFSWLFILALLTFSWRVRRSMKLLSFGFFFYFVGHLMESTLIPLELYFEHRNYLPQLGLWLALASIISQLRSARLLRTIGVSSLILIIMLSIMTRENASLWSQTDLQVTMWYKENPGSQRSTQAYLNVLLKNNQLEEADRVFENSLKLMPNNIGLAVAKRYVDCYLRNMPTTFEDLAGFARNADYDLSSILMLERMRSLSSQKPSLDGGCQIATANQIGLIYMAMLKNPNFNTSSIHSRLNEYLSEIAVSNGNLNAAIHHLDKAYQSSKNPIYPYRQAKLLLSAGLLRDASGALEIAESSMSARFALLYPDLEARINDLKKSIATASLSPS